MFCDVNYPAHLSPHTLDKYLEKGWFRMGQSMFTTSFLYFNDVSYNAIWLRYDLSNYELRKSSKLILKTNAKFKVQINPFTYSPSKERLFSKYRANLPFGIAPTLGALLLEEGQFNIFNSYEVCIYDDKKLVAMGIFDLGDTSAQGIVNFYDPDYRKYSLGKFVILQKVLYLKSQGFTYFYPGYFVPGYALFDYKIELLSSGMSFYEVASESWKPMTDFMIEKCPLNLIYEKLKILESTTTAKSLKLKTYFYKFYDVKLFKEYSSYDLISFPYFIILKALEPHKLLILTYDVRLGKYQIIISCHVFNIQLPKIPNQYNSNFLRVEDIIYEHKSMDAVLDFLNS